MWKPVKNWEHLLEVNKFGAVRTIDRMVKARGGRYRRCSSVVKTPHLTLNGYMALHVYYQGKYKDLYLHRILAETFIPNPENKRTINHIDGVKTNNRLSNLEWATDSENIKHAWRTGLRTYTGKMLSAAYKRRKKVTKYSMQGLPICSYVGVKLAANENGTQPSHINSVCKGSRNSAGGYKWKYC